MCPRRRSPHMSVDQAIAPVLACERIFMPYLDMAHDPILVMYVAVRLPTEGKLRFPQRNFFAPIWPVAAVNAIGEVCRKHDEEKHQLLKTETISKHR